MRSCGYVLGGCANGDTVLDHGSPFFYCATCHFVSKGNGRGQSKAVLGGGQFQLEIEQSGDVVVSVNSEANASHISDV